MKGEIKYVEVLDDKGAVQVIDIFIDGAWHGSRRTMAQCREYTSQAAGKSSVMIGKD